MLPVGDSLRVAIDARGRRGSWGGVETVVMGLCYGLASLEGDEEYYLLTDRGLQPLPIPYTHQAVAGIVLSDVRKFRSRLLDRMPLARDAYDRARRLPRSRAAPTIAPPPTTDGVIERGGIDVIHFTTQSAFLTPVPSLYHPHDLQHEHHPEFFDRESILRRRRHYTAFAAAAAYVPVASSWIAEDVHRHLGVERDRIKVVPWAAVLPAYPEPSPSSLDGTREAHQLPTSFAFYPAQSWPHKNHVVLLRSLALMRSRGMDVPVVFSGGRTAYAEELDDIARGLGVADLVHWIGFVPDRDLRAIYALARVVAIPTGFEAASFPMWEAFYAGVPVVSSDVTSLPRQAAGAALVVPVGDHQKLADALSRLWNDEALRERMITAGRSRSDEFSWQRTAATFRALYRLAAGRNVTRTDQELLEDPPLL